MNLWQVDPDTGEYPFLRILWCIMWAIPICVTILMVVALIFIQAGPKAAREAWELFL